jgi:hypothetical protein
MHLTHEMSAARRARIAELQHGGDGNPPLTRKQATAAADAESGYTSPAPTQSAGTAFVFEERTYGNRY